MYASFPCQRVGKRPMTRPFEPENRRPRFLYCIFLIVTDRDFRVNHFVEVHSCVKCSGDIKKIQHDILFSKTPEERMEQGLQFIDEMHQVRINGLKAAYPNLSHEQIIIVMMKKMRKDDEQLAWLDTIGVWEKLPIDLQ